MTVKVGRKTKRQFTPEQKFQIVQDIKAQPTVKVGLERHQITHGMYHKWKRQLEVGIQASLRNTKPLQPHDQRQMEIENRKLKEMVLNLTHDVCELKKVFSLKP
jgi:transposase-like protein